MVMQPTDVQVERTLAALEVDTVEDGARPLRVGIPRDSLEILLQDLPVGLLAALESPTAVREDRLQEARDRMVHGDAPSSDELANRIVGRMVCDRLR
jgi:hypothetical protein